MKITKLVVLLLLLWMITAMAAVTGSNSGYMTNKETGILLPASIKVIQGNKLDAVFSKQVAYAIVRVPAGNNTRTVSYKDSQFSTEPDQEPRIAKAIGHLPRIPLDGSSGAMNSCISMHYHTVFNDVDVKS